ncbi:MAG: hypothetical protein IKH54_06605 [Bacilli bacterium]|nr:hypothetical protein [Bacilli bacterium]
MNKKRLIFIGLIVLIIVGLVFINSKFNNKSTISDAMKFKEEYESLNNTKNDNGKEYRNISIPSDNPFLYVTADDIVKKMDNKESFAVYFGFSKCPWCRSVLPTLIDVANDLGIDSIYYVDVLDIRNTKEVKDGKAVETKKGTSAYYKLLDKLDSVLDDYSLKDENGNDVPTNQNRIYAPNVVTVLAGKPESLTTGIADSQDDAYMDLSDEMISDTYNKFKCTLECLSTKDTVCTKNAC